MSPSARRSQAPSPISQTSRILLVSTLCSIAVSFAVWKYLNSDPFSGCQAPPEGFECVYCGPQLMAIRSTVNPSIFAVVATHSDSPGFIVQSYFDLKRRISHSRYVERILQLLKKLGRKNILLLGLGGGAIPALASTRIRDCRITAVDISPDSLAIVRKFVLPDDGANIRYIEQSAEEFLKSEQSDRYDVVIEDMYDDDDVPEFIFDREYMQNIHRVLNDEGMYMSNCLRVEGQVLDDRLSRTIHTIDGIFPDFGVSEIGRHGNVILVASKVKNNLQELSDRSLAAREADDVRPYDDLIQPSA